jgi:S-adenosyl-L-methionine hydrolase (adenosine-forming)
MSLKTISITTDFGLQEANVAVMKGVIWRIAPQVDIADLSHLIAAQNILEGAIVLNHAIFYFPPGSVHIGVIDPGVGTSRRPIAARLGDQFFVGPDNGLITLILEQAEDRGFPIEIIHLNNPHFWLPEISAVFHGRDIFSPVAAHIANGVPMHELGVPISDPIRLPLTRPERLGKGWRGQVMHVDHFGNLGTNLEAKQLQGMQNIKILLNEKIIDGLVRTFGDRPSGSLIALIDSSGYLAISIVNGDAQSYLKAKVGDIIEVEEG